MNSKQILKLQQAPAPHWVGDGFPVTSLFAMQSDIVNNLSPFLMLDYAAPTKFPPSNELRGVGGHPHKGFETVTIVYQGALQHRDSTGASGIIGPGDVQWMTAASGVVHEEMHEKNWAQQGGVFQVAQLWVNLPAKYKAAQPRYQTLLNAQIPVVNLPDNAGKVRVIAGEYKNEKGAAKTFTPINLYDVQMKAGHTATFNLPPNHNTTIAVLAGEVLLNGSQPASQVSAAIFDTGGEMIKVEAKQNSTLLVLDGEPIEEPVVSYGPFVMNSHDEIKQAIADFQSGKMGTLDG